MKMRQFKELLKNSKTYHQAMAPEFTLRKGPRSLLHWSTEEADGT